MTIRNRIVVTIFLSLGTITGGTIGYRLLEGWSWLDSLYMTVITLTTVGFGEINPLSSSGRVFTILVILGGAGVVAYALSSVAEILASGDLARMLRKRRRIVLKDHCIVCGFGRVGRSVATELAREGVPFVIVDKSEQAVEESQLKGYNAVLGNASNAEVLKGAGIASAKSLVASAHTDAENVFIILTVRELRDDILIVTRLNEEESEPKLRKAGADKVISPYTIAGHRIVHTISRPTVADFLETVLQSENTEMWIEEIQIQAGSQLANRTLGDSRLRSEVGVTVLAADLPDKKVITHPQANTPLEVGARLIVLGTREELKKLSELAGSTDGKN